MAERALAETTRLLNEARERTKSIAVAYSGGKDSLVVMDLASRSFDRVEAFFMYFVPGLECVDVALSECKRRWGVKVRQYPHWLVRKCIVGGAYCPNTVKHDDMPEWKLQDVYAFARHDCKVPLVATGAKRADSLWRRRNLATMDSSDLLYPIIGWNKFDVFGYLRGRNIPIPSSSGKSATGIDLSTPSILWLHDTYPDDFKKLCEVFPYAEAVVWRRKWYGVEA